LQPAIKEAEIVLRHIEKGKQIIIKYNLQEIKKILPLHSRTKRENVLKHNKISLKNYFKIIFGKTKKVVTFAVPKRGRHRERISVERLTKVSYDKTEESASGLQQQQDIKSIARCNRYKRHTATVITPKSSFRK
jgi:hypothetical protein